jgi:acyl-CoA dehydrogenase
MAWDFETDPEYQKTLDWADEFVREEVEPLDLAFPHQQFVPLDGKRRKAIDPLKEEGAGGACRATTSALSWAARATDSSSSLLNEILGRSRWAPIVFGCQAPDTGNAGSSPTTAPRLEAALSASTARVSCFPAIR